VTNTQFSVLSELFHKFNEAFVTLAPAITQAYYQRLYNPASEQLIWTPDIDYPVDNQSQAEQQGLVAPLQWPNNG
jgi:hypothetical protein